MAKENKDGGTSGGESASSGAEDTARQAQQAGQQGTESMARASRESMEAMRQGGERSRRAAEAGLGQAADLGMRTTEQMRGLMNASARAYRDMGSVPGADVDSLMQTGARLAKGMQDMSWEMMQFSQNSWRMTMRVANQMMGCRSVEDMMQLQRDFVRESMDNLLQESARLLEMSSSVATEAPSQGTERGGGQGARH